jgi:putative serine/threonine protein kinase
MCLQTGEVVSLKGLHKRIHGQVLCYPRCEPEEWGSRLKELERLKVRAVEFTGEKRVFELPVLGKGCVGIVVTAYTSLGRAALKIRRIDADRKGMFHESKMLKRANAMKVGPQLLGVSENFLLMEFVEGINLPQWVESLSGNDVQSRVRRVLHDILEQCYRLDEAGLDHGELSNAPKHIIVNADEQPFLVDFETASINRKVANVTSVCQYLFFRSQVAEKVKEKLGEIEKKELIIALRTYKGERTRKNFEKLLEKSCFLNNLL